MFVPLKDVKRTLCVQGFEYDTRTLAGFMLAAADAITASPPTAAIRIKFISPATHQREGEHANTSSKGRGNNEQP
jgi:hypothetical protein